MNIEEKFRQETGKSLYADNSKEIGYSTDYVNWLEKQLRIGGVIGCFKTLEECEKESIEFTKDEMKVVGGLLPDDYKTGYKEGVEHYLQKHNNL